MPLIRREPPPPRPTAEADSAATTDDLRSQSAERRWSAARLLAADPTAAPALGAALAVEPDARVRAAMLTSLVSIATPDSVAAVLPHLRSDRADLRNAALDALKLMPAAMRPHLAPLLRDPDPDVRLLACNIAREMPFAEVGPLLAAVLDDDPSVNVCVAAIEVLSEVGGPEAIPMLLRCATRFADQPFLVFAARVAVERIGGGSAAAHE